MSDTTTGSTVPRRQLGRYLRDLRNQQRLTVRAAAERLEWSEAKIWRIETGQTSLRSLDVEAVCRVYGAPADLTEALMGLAKETKAKGWWQAYGDAVPEWFDVYIGLEEAASQISWYESELVPGLFQTDGYARTVIKAEHHDDGEEEIDRRVQLRVVPFSAGVHLGLMTGPFEILRFPRNGDGRDSEPPTVYADGFTGALYLDKPHEIERYATAFENIWSISLDEAGSKRLIHRAAKELQP